MRQMIVVMPDTRGIAAAAPPVPGISGFLAMAAMNGPTGAGIFTRRPGSCSPIVTQKRNNRTL